MIGSSVAAASKDHETTAIRPSAQAEKALRSTPQFTRFARHARSVLKRSTPRRLANLLLVEAEYRLRKTRLRGRPYVLIIDPLNVCNLRCPLCPTGTFDLGRKAGAMDWETFTKAIDALAPWAYELNLYNWGESILHPHFYDMVEYAEGRGLATSVSANMNDVTPEAIDRLILSGLSNLTLSIDGATQEVYSQYRVKGDLKTVLANVRALVRRRDELGRRTPHIEWQYIVMKQNHHQIAEAQALAEEIGVDDFRPMRPGVPFFAADQEKLKADWFINDDDGGYIDHSKPHSSSCFYLYRSFVVNPDGGTAPCCIVYGDNNDFGNILQNDFGEIWNNDRYQSARALFRDGGQSPEPTVCDTCTIFTQRSPKTRELPVPPE